MSEYPSNMKDCPVDDCDGCVDSDGGGDFECCHCGVKLSWVDGVPYAMVPCARCGKWVRDVDSWGDGDVGDFTVPSYCGPECWNATTTKGSP